MIDELFIIGCERFDVTDRQLVQISNRMSSTLSTVPRARLFACPSITICAS